MKFTRLALPDIVLIEPKRFGDDRGYFVETFNAPKFAETGITFAPVQENQSFSRIPGTLRGLHFQRAPFAQSKLVRVLRGHIFDVAVDIRPQSATFGQWVSAELTAENGHQLFIPAGFAHGFCTLQPDVEIAYLVDNVYSPECDGAIRFDDPQIGITWPDGAGSVVSDKDKNAPKLADAKLK